MSFDLNGWLTEFGEALSAEEKAQAIKIFGKETVSKKLGESVLRQSDYSRQVAEAKRQQEAAAATIRANTDWKANAERELAAAQRDRDAERTTRAQYEAELKRIEDEYGVEVKRTAAPAPEPTRTEPPAAPQFKKDIDDLRMGMAQTPQLTALIMDINAEHTELFGKPLRNTREIVAESMKSGRTVREVWEEKNGVPDRRAQIQRDAEAAKEAQIRADERTRVISEMSAPQQHRLTPTSTVFEKVTPGSAPGQNSGVLSAVAAFNAHKYAGNTP